MAEYLWHRDYYHNPFATRRGHLEGAIQKSHQTFPRLRQLILVSDRIESLDSEEERGRRLSSWEYDGASP
jgi:hypothetical protein